MSALELTGVMSACVVIVLNCDTSATVVTVVSDSTFSPVELCAVPSLLSVSVPVNIQEDHVVSKYFYIIFA